MTCSLECAGSFRAAPTHSNTCPRISVQSFAFLCIASHSHVFPSIPSHSHTFPHISSHSHAFPHIPMHSHASLNIPTHLHTFPCIQQHGGQSCFWHICSRVEHMLTNKIRRHAWVCALQHTFAQLQNTICLRCQLLPVWLWLRISWLPYTQSAKLARLG